MGEEERKAGHHAGASGGMSTIQGKPTFREPGWRITARTRDAHHGDFV
jgi:hypothetical protein